MKKENVLFGVIGLFAGLIIGFLVTNSLNKGSISLPTAVSDARLNSNIPPNHPAIGGERPGTGPATGNPQPDVQAAIEKAKQSPGDFEAQINAAEMYYKIERFDEALALYKRASQLRPDNREVIVQLGNVNFDAEHYEEAEKWYLQALAKKADDPDVRTDLGLAFMLRNPPDYDRAIEEFNRSLSTEPNHLQTLRNLAVAYTRKGDATKATSTVAKLEAVDPKNQAIATLKDEIAKIKPE